MRTAEVESRPKNAEIYELASQAALIYSYLSESDKYPQAFKVIKGLDVRRKKVEGKLVDRPRFMRVMDYDNGKSYNVTFDSPQPFSRYDSDGQEAIGNISIRSMPLKSTLGYGTIRGSESLSYLRERDREKLIDLWYGKIIPLALEHMGFQAIAEGEVVDKENKG